MKDNPPAYNSQYPPLPQTGGTTVMVGTAAPPGTGNIMIYFVTQIILLQLPIL